MASRQGHHLRRGQARQGVRFPGGAQGAARGPMARGRLVHGDPNAHGRSGRRSLQRHGANLGRHLRRHGCQRQHHAHRREGREADQVSSQRQAQQQQEQFRARRVGNFRRRALPRSREAHRD